MGVFLILTVFYNVLICIKNTFGLLGIKYLEMRDKSPFQRTIEKSRKISGKNTYFKYLP